MGKYMRMLLAVLLAACFALAPRAEAAQTLKVGIVPGTGFIEEDRPGHLRGIGYEYMEFLSGFGGWKFQYVPCVNWWEAGEKLQSGEIDLLPAMPGDYRTMPFATRTEHVIARFPMELVVHDGVLPMNMRLGTLDYNYPIPSLPKVAADYGFSYNLVPFHDATDMENAFGAGQIDGYVAPLLQPDKPVKILSLFDRVSYRLLVRSDRQDLLAQVNAAMDQLMMTQPNIRSTLRNKYERANGYPLVLTAEEKRYLAAKKSFKVAVFLPQKPFFYRDENTGEWAGATMSLLKKLESDLHIELEIIEEDSLENIRRLISRGNIDFLVDVPCDFSWLQGLNLYPTQPYRTVDYTPIIRGGFELPPIPKVAVVKDVFQTFNFVKNNYADHQVVYCQTLAECLRAVSNGRADVTYAPRAAVPYLMGGSFTYNLEAPTESLFSDNLSLGVSQQADPLLWQILNKEIAHLPPHFLQSALLEAGTVEVKGAIMTPKKILYQYPLLSTVAIFIIMSFIIGVLYYRYYMRRRHMIAIQQMAFMDTRYQLPNMLWLEQELKTLWDEAHIDDPQVKIYVAVFDLSSRDSMLELYSRHMLDMRLQEAAAHLQAEDWIMEVVSGVNTLQLVCLCKADDNEEIVTLAAEAVASYGYIEHDNTRISLHIKVGLCLLKDQKYLLDAEEKADMACRKIMGTMDIVKLYDEKMNRLMNIEQSIENSMSRALTDGEFKVWFQPKYDIATKHIVGAESLLRWQSSEMGFITPDRFLPSLEMNGFIIPVDHFVLKQVMMLQKHRLAEGLEVIPISVNQSRLHITEDGYLRKMKELMEKYHLPRGCIQLEMPETMFENFHQKTYRDHAVYTMEALHNFGYGLVLDNFGYVASSFTLLDYLPLEAVKIHPAILAAAQTSPGMQKVLESIISLCHKMNLTAIGVGVETVEQERMLASMGCHYGQGILNARPLPKDKFLELVKDRNG